MLLIAGIAITTDGATMAAIGTELLRHADRVCAMLTRLVKRPGI